MVFVDSLDLKEFRGIRAFKKPLELAKFNVLVGRNNSEKSAILHALSLLPHPDITLPMSLDVYNWKTRIGVFEYLLGGKSSAVYRYAGAASLAFTVKEKACHAEIGDRGDLF